MNQEAGVHAFLLGAPKCGTTWLSNALEQHPGLCVSDPKEPNEIATHKGTMFRDNREPNLKKYAKYFKGKGMKIDCSVHAFACPKAPSRIKNNWPNAKFIICVREPVARTISHWKMIRETEMDIRSGADWSNFEIAWNDSRLHLDTLYGHCFQNWLAKFPRKSFLILDSEFMKKQPIDALKMVCDHLEISQIKFNLDNISNSNTAKDRKMQSRLGRKIMAASSKIPNFVKFPITLPLKALGINIYNTKAMTSKPKIAEIDYDYAKKIISPKTVKDIELFESISGESFTHWK